jgi:glycoprotein 6-alpha-L-fucosyltransferase
VGTEAEYHSLDEYMRHVSDYYDVEDMRQKDNKKLTRRVFLATDELKIFDEIKEYEKLNFTFVFNREGTELAIKSRDSPLSAQHIINDMHFLSECEFLVCTMTSTVCRIVYELAQMRKRDGDGDASWRFRSPDDFFFVHEGTNPRLRALYDHTPNRNNTYNEVDMIAGDAVKIAGR